MKKKIFALAAMAIYVAILVSGSLAYFTAEDRAVNVITIGKVDIEIVEYHKNKEDGKLEEIHYDENADDKGMPDSFKNIEPGQRIVKKVDIENRGLNTAWIRAKIEDRIVDASGENELPDTVIRYNINNLLLDDEDMTGVWEQGEDGYWYYTEAVAVNETVTLFDVVTFDGPSMGNAYQGCTTYIQIYADAVQTEGIGANSCVEAYQKLNEVSQGGAG